MDKPFAFRELTNTKSDRFDEGLLKSHRGKGPVKTMEINSESKPGLFFKQIDKSTTKADFSKTSWPDKEQAGQAYNPLGIDVGGRCLTG